MNTDALPQVKAENTRLKAEVGKLTSDVQALRSNESQLLMKAEALDKTAKEVWYITCPCACTCTFYMYMYIATCMSPLGSCTIHVMYMMYMCVYYYTSVHP